MTGFSRIMRMEGEEQLPEILVLLPRIILLIASWSAGDAALDGIG